VVLAAPALQFARLANPKLNVHLVSQTITFWAIPVQQHVLGIWYPMELPALFV